MKTKKPIVLFALAVLLATVMAGCSDGQKETAAVDVAPGTTAEATAKEASSETTTVEETMAEESTAEEDGESYDTGDASLDNTRNQDEIGGSELLVVSLGTNYNDNRCLTAGATEDTTEKAFPGYSVRRESTSRIIIDHARSRDQVSIDNVGKVLDRAVDNKAKNLVTQPTRLMNGLECMDPVDEVVEYSGAFERVAVGEPLFTTDDDSRTVVRTITKVTAEYDDGETAICFMGYGTEAGFNQVYSKMQDMLADIGYNNYYMGTMEALPAAEDVLAAAQVGGHKKVVLEPLMIVAGDHANNDMAGDGEGSWKEAFEGAGYEVTCLVRGFGGVETTQQLFVEHTKAAVESLSK